MAHTLKTEHKCTYTWMAIEAGKVDQAIEADVFTMFIRFLLALLTLK